MRRVVGVALLLAALVGLASPGYRETAVGHFVARPTYACGPARHLRCDKTFGWCFWHAGDRWCDRHYPLTGLTSRPHDVSRDPGRRTRR